MFYTTVKVKSTLYPFIYKGSTKDSKNDVSCQYLTICTQRHYPYYNYIDNDV